MPKTPSTRVKIAVTGGIHRTTFPAVIHAKSTENGEVLISSSQAKKIIRHMTPNRIGKYEDSHLWMIAGVPPCVFWRAFNSQTEPKE